MLSLTLAEIETLYITITLLNYVLISFPTSSKRKEKYNTDEVENLEKKNVKSSLPSLKHTISNFFSEVLCQSATFWSFIGLMEL